MDSHFVISTIRYTRHEFHHLSEVREASLAVFCYDVPYLIVFNIFPPLPILNQLFMTGGSQGGMSPGATWIPFQINSAEYDALLPQVLYPDLATLQQHARYALFPCVLDHAFDAITDRFTWMQAVSAKHRDDYFIRQREQYGF